MLRGIFEFFYEKTRNRASKTNSAHSLIVGNELFSHGWNDPSEILNESHTIILDVVYDESPVDKFSYWNKKYYNFLAHQYSISENQLESISSIVNISPDKHRELFKHWPNSISLNTYNKLYDILKLDFVQTIPITQEFKHRYAIVLNGDFWDIPKSGSNVLVEILNGYERRFADYELIHNRRADALNYGLIIYSMLCAERPPDTEYYYHEKIKSQIGGDISIPSFIFKSNSIKKEAKIAEYSRIISEEAIKLAHMRRLYSMLPEKPFELVKL